MTAFRCNRYKAGGTGVINPDIKAFYSKNAGSAGRLSHTFNEAGTFQYIVCLRLGDASTGVLPVIQLNGTTLTPLINNTISGLYFCYNEITVNAGDILTATHQAYSNSGFQLIILQGMTISNLSVVGFYTNTGQTFTIPQNTYVLEVYRCGYYSSNNNYNYTLLKGGGLEQINSVATPNESRFWYGFTYAITI